MTMAENPGTRPWGALGSFVMRTRQGQFGVGWAVVTEPERCHAPIDEGRGSESLSLAWWVTLMDLRTGPI